MSKYIPITPRGTWLYELASTTEDDAWNRLLGESQINPEDYEQGKVYLSGLGFTVKLGEDK
jgi:hypothetical protein